MLLSTKLLFITASTMLLLITNTTACEHDTIFKDLKKQYMDPTPLAKSRILAPNTPHKLRIFIDYKQADAFVASNPSLQTKYDMAKRILTNVKKYFETYITVKDAPTSMTNSADKTCQSETIPIFTKDIDLYLTIKAENASGKAYFAAASPCVQDSTTKRPIMGIYLLNFVSMDTSATQEFLYFSTFAHEFTHILGFAKSLYNEYLMPDGTTTRPLNQVIGSKTISGTTYKTVILPEVLAKAKTHYGCNSIDGVPLENDGSSGTKGSHWEKLFFSNEYMNPTIENPGIISEITFSLLQGTGWYSVYYAGVMVYDWGKGDGCDHFKHCPAKGNEYCEATAVGKGKCMQGFGGKGVCTAIPSFINNCNVVRSVPNALCSINQNVGSSKGRLEVYGSHGRCIKWAAKGQEKSHNQIPQCHLTKCDKGKVKIKLSDGRMYICREDGQLINFGSHNMICPKAADFCSDFDKRCPLDCSGHGICLVANQCFCFEGFGGSDCNDCATCKTTKDTFVLSAKFGGPKVIDTTEETRIGELASKVLEISIVLVLGKLFLLK